MNFRTTILLLVLLIAVAAVFFLSSGKFSSQNDAIKKDDVEKKLLTINAPDVKRVVVAPASGERLAFVRAGTSEWRLAEPVDAPADAFKVDDLVREVLALSSRGQVEPGDKGVDAPQYTIELTDGKDKTTTIKVGNRSPVGDMLYVRLDGDKQADIVSASIVEQLEKPASEYRKARLLTVTNDKVTGVTVAQGDKTLRLEKSANDKWQIVEPKQIPGDAGQIAALLSAVTGLDAVKFVSEDAKAAASYGLAKPAMTVTLTTQPPSTQPSTGPAATAATKPAGEATTVKFGRQDVLKQNVYAMVSDAGPIVTVAASVLEGLKKSPLDLRDRQVLELDSDAVSRMTLSIDRAATTQPTSQPADKKELVLERRSEVTPAGPPAPKAKPAAAPANEAAAPGDGTNGDVPQPDAAPAPGKAKADAPKAGTPAPAAAESKPDVPAEDAPAAPENGSEAEPQARETTPDGNGVVRLAAFQAQPAPAESKPEASESAESAPEAPAAPADAEPADAAPADAEPADATPADAEPAEAKPVDGDAGDENPKPTAPAADAPRPDPANSDASPATAPAATQPAVPPSKWLIASEPKGDANDGHVQALLAALRPLRAEKYLESFPTTQATPAGTYVLKISTRSWGDEPAREHELKITDPGGDAKLIGEMDDLIFELDRTVLEKLTADFAAPNTAEPADFGDGAGSPPPFEFPGGPGGPPPGAPR